MTPITLPRAVVEQALEALLKSHTCPLLPDDCEEAITSLRAALAQQAEPSPFGCVTVRRLSLRHENHADQYQFYPAGQSPYLDNVDECHIVYTAPPQQAEPVEPVAWMYTGIKQDGTEHGPHLVWKPEYMDAMSASKGAKATPLYAAPPQRKPLTQEEITTQAEKVLKPSVYHDAEALIGTDGLVALVRAVEQAHGIKE